MKLYFQNAYLGDIDNQFFDQPQVHGLFRARPEAEGFQRFFAWMVDEDSFSKESHCSLTSCSMSPTTLLRQKQVGEIARDMVLHGQSRKERSMSYRRDNEGQRAWQAWVHQHREALLQCSLPEFIFSDEPRWLRFVGHHGWDQESGWNITMLSPDQSSALYDLLTSEYGSDEYRHLLRTLDESRRKSRRPDDAHRNGPDHMV